MWVIAIRVVLVLACVGLVSYFAATRVARYRAHRNELRESQRRRDEEAARREAESVCAICGNRGSFHHPCAVQSGEVQTTRSRRRDQRFKAVLRRGGKTLWRCAHTSHRERYVASGCAVRALHTLQYGKATWAVELRERLPTDRRMRQPISPEETERRRLARNEYQQRYRQEKLAVDPSYFTEMKRRWRAANPAKYAANKARARGASVVHLVEPTDVFRRDGWICYLCGGKVTAADASLDHIVPIARGGEHTIDNLACTHRECNYAKGHRELIPCTSCGELVIAGPRRCPWCGFLYQPS